MSDEELTLRVLVTRINMFNGRADEAKTFGLRESAVYRVSEHDVVDPFIWDLQLAHDGTGIGGK